MTNQDSTAKVMSPVVEEKYSSVPVSREIAQEAMEKTTIESPMKVVKSPNVEDAKMKEEREKLRSKQVEFAKQNLLDKFTLAMQDDIKKSEYAFGVNFVNNLIKENPEFLFESKEARNFLIKEGFTIKNLENKKFITKPNQNDIEAFLAEAKSDKFRGRANFERIMKKLVYQHYDSIKVGGWASGSKTGSNA